MEKGFSQLCVWPATVMGENTPEEFEAFILEKFGARVRFAEEVVTLPCPKRGETGNRHDLFFFVRDEDIPHFAVKRLAYGIRWWEDVLLNGDSYLYATDVLARYRSSKD